MNLLKKKKKEEVKEEILDTKEVEAKNPTEIPEHLKPIAKIVEEFNNGFGQINLPHEALGAAILALVAEQKKTNELLGQMLRE